MAKMKKATAKEIGKMMNQMKELSMNSMENANGGAVVKYCGM